jgi:ribA/ribD-fused uncharacterized protein
VETKPLIIPDDNRILFFDRDRQGFGFLSNFREAPITLDGLTWRSTEYYYQAQKSRFSDYRQAIREAKSPGHAKRPATDPRLSKKIGKQSWFYGRENAIRADWQSVKLSIMESAVRAKFNQHADLKRMLLETLDAEIIEDSGFDSFWGIGKDGQGTNRMGTVLVAVRTELRNI